MYTMMVDEPISLSIFCEFTEKIKVDYFYYYFIVCWQELEITEFPIDNSHHVKQI